MSDRKQLSPSSQQRAERLQRSEIEGRAARAEYDEAARAEAEKTVRLRALRLERDRLEAEANPPAKPTVKPKTKARRKTARA